MDAMNRFFVRMELLFCIGFLAKFKARIPVLTSPIDGLSLFQSDEFDSESGLWNINSGSNLNIANYQYESGELKLLYTETEGVFEGHRQELQYVRRCCIRTHNGEAERR